MTHFIKAIAATTIFAASASTAFAGTSNQSGTFDATFKYDAKAKVEQNYADFKRTVKSVCRQEALKAGYTRKEIRSSVTASCERKLLESAVKKTNNTAIAAVHANSTGR